MSHKQHPPRAFSLRARRRSFVFAGRGLRTMVATQHNAQLHALATLAALGLGCVLRVSRLDWIAILLAVVMVWAAEAINTAFEFLCDVASPEFHPLVERAKDVAAGAVLICALGASLVGALVFGPPLVQALQLGIGR